MKVAEHTNQPRYLRWIENGTAAAVYWGGMAAWRIVLPAFVIIELANASVTALEWAWPAGSTKSVRFLAEGLLDLPLSTWVGCGALFFLSRAYLNWLVPTR